MIKISKIITVLLFISSVGYAQMVDIDPLQVNFKWIGEQSADRGMCVIQNAPDNFLIAAMTMSEGSGNADILVMAVDSGMNVKWKKVYGGKGYDFPFSMTSSGNDVIITAFSGSFRSDGFDSWVLKINHQGDTIWTKHFGREGDNRAYRAVATKDGGCIVVGQTAVGGIIKGQLLKLDFYGEVVWQREYENTKLTRAYSVIELKNGDYLVSGITNANYPENANIILFRTDNMGRLQWKKTFDGVRGSIAHSMIKFDEETVLLIGYSAEHSYPLAQPLVMKVDHDGNLVNTYSVNSDLDVKLMDGFLHKKVLYAAGHVRENENASSSSDIVVMTLDLRRRNGSPKMNRIRLSVQDDEIYSLVLCGKKDALMIGHGTRPGRSDSDILLAKWRWR